MKVEDQIIFTARHGGDWKVAEGGLFELEDEKVAHFIASVANTANPRIPGYLTEVMNVDEIMNLSGKFEDKDLSETIVALKSPGGTARTLGKLVFEEDKKLKKHLTEVARALLVRETLSKKVPVEYPEKPPLSGGVRIEFPPYEEEHINFVAFHLGGKTKWRAVRRLIIDEKTPPMADVARLLASINESITLKLPPVYAGIDTEGIEAWFGSSKKVKKAEIAAVVERYLEFPAEDYAPAGFEGGHARVYALRTALEKIGLPLDVPAKSLEKYLEKK